AVTKKAQRISDDGKGEVFKDTKEVAVKKYNGAETKFIRSHMPFSRSFKMGASGLKTKPIRLIFTILLSVVSFTMFGIASTLMLYDSAYSLSDALKNMDRTSEAVVKQYDYNSKSVTINNATGEVEREGSEYPGTGDAYFGVQEVKDLNAQNNNRFLPVYTLSSGGFSLYNRPFSFQNVMVNGDSKEYYSYNGFSGLTDASREQISQVGAQLTGEHPKATNEIAISNYHFDLLKESGALGTLNDKNSILNKELDLYFYGKNWMSVTAKMKIVGVYDFGNIPSTYDAVKAAKEPSVSQIEREQQVDAFDNFIASSTYTIGYVAPEFYETYGYVPSDNRSYIDNVWPRGILCGDSMESLDKQPVNNDSGFSAYLIENLEGAAGVVYYDKDFKEVTNVTLGDSDVLLPYDQYYMNSLREKNWMPIEDFKQKLDNYKNYYSEEERQMLEEMNNWEEGYESTSDLVNAYIRMRDAFNKGGELIYPGGHTLEEDTATVKAGFNALYAKVCERYYLCDAYSYISNYYMERSIETPTTWEATSEIYSKLNKYEENATDDEVLTFKNNIKGYYETEGADAAYLLKAVRADTIFNVTNDQYRSKVENKIRELYGEEVGLYTVINGFLVDHENPEIVERFDTSYTYAYKLLKGEEAAVTFEFDPSFIGEFVMRESKLDNPSFFTKDMSGTIKEYNVKGYAKVGDRGWEPVLTRNAIKNYLQDSYSWKNVYETSYQSPADAKYAYLIATNANYSESDISAFTAKHETYFYDMTNSVYQLVSRSTKMIEELKTVFLIIGAVTGGLAGLLLLNFISVSISSKNKDIGILRAVGARGSDVFKIFFSESSIITLICFILSAVAAGFVCNYLNQQLSESMIGVKLLNYGIINIGLILGVALVISFIATFIPVLIASKKPPVEAIRSL
ncbi:MAG: FtsX-like permease family protein, partial [Bacilli bacterium]|nr:FtsX-like permease family protein [Bacilli bacterium]